MKRLANLLLVAVTLALICFVAAPGVAFFARFRDMVASGFFSSAIGWKDLQYQGNVFNPKWDGCPQPALDKLKVSYDVMATRVAPQGVSSK